MRKVFGCVLVAFALFAGTAGFVVLSAQQVSACEKDYKGT
jgi:hypothetical protein